MGELSGALPWVIQMEHFQQFSCCEHEKEKEEAGRTSAYDEEYDSVHILCGLSSRKGTAHNSHDCLQWNDSASGGDFGRRAAVMAHSFSSTPSL